MYVLCPAVCQGLEHSNRSERLQPGPIHGHVDEVHRRAGRHHGEPLSPHMDALPNKNWCQRNAMSSHSVYSSSQLGGTCVCRPCNQTKAVPQPTPSCVPIALASKVAPGGLTLEELSSCSMSPRVLGTIQSYKLPYTDEPAFFDTSASLMYCVSSGAATARGGSARDPV